MLSTGCRCVANDDDEDVDEFVDFGAPVHVILKKKAFDEKSKSGAESVDS